MKLKTLKSALPRLNSARIAVISINPIATPRLRGRAGVERRAKWLAKNPLCIDCEEEGRVTAGEEVDHEIPLWQGGADDESNFATRCIEHHKSKTAREAAERGIHTSRRFD